MRIPRILMVVAVLCSLWTLSGCDAQLRAGFSVKRGDEAPAESGSRQYLLEKVDDVAVVQLYADGFERLAVNEKILIYHLYQAALAGRDIFIDQKYKYSLEIRPLIEAVLTHPEGIDPETLAEVRRYTKLFWINNGPHNAITGRKNVLNCSFEAFLVAVQTSERAGATLSGQPGESTTALVERLRPVLFDPAVDAQVTNKSPGAGKDILVASANNLYENVTMQDLVGFQEKHPLNSKLVKDEDGQLREIVWRAGFDSMVPAGMYASQIKQVVSHLEAAIDYATPRMARALGALVHYYRTGNPQDFRAYNIAWVADTESPVDTINGFIEVYVDARGQKGAWEGLVYFNDPAKMEMMEVIAENAQWFEDHMPYAPEFRKAEVKGISAKAIQVIIETGDSGPVSPIGINLPNAQDVRSDYGSKSVSISNVIEAYDQSRSPETRREFCYTEEALARVDRWKTTTLDLHVNLHEVVGHASGKLSPELKVNPEDVIKEFYSALEEARADLVALWFVGDPRLVDLGLIQESDRSAIELAAYEIYTRNALAQLRRVREGTTLEEDHMRNRQMIVHWLMENSESIEIRKQADKTYYVVTDAVRWKAGVGRLLAEVQRIKSEGDYDAAKKLFTDHGIHFDPDLRDEVVARWDALKQPSYTGFVMPELTAHRDAAGEIRDVTVGYPLDLERQMLRWSGH
ncbi:MAG: peptidase M49 [Planctomycetes bacterium]|nr:peptidase M49 [Planctomycetota bacterium]